MATVTPRAIWKGAISFGLVHVPVALYSAIQDTRPKMRMLDQATGAPVGYQKVAKDTGQAVDKGDVVKGMEVDPGQFVTLTREEIREALPRSTQTIEIEGFVKREDVPATYFNKPYITGPVQRGRKVYALLREALQRTGRAALGRVVIANKQHLALVAPAGNALMLYLLRWADEIRDPAAVDLPGTAADEGVNERELKMGEQLVLELSDDWHPERFRDEFREKLEALVEAKRQAGDVRKAPMVEDEPAIASSADVIDLTELLRRSLQGAAATPAAASTTTAKARATRRPAATRRAANDEATSQRAAAAAEPVAKKTASAKVKPRAPAKKASSRSG
ncbi:Ku protein [Ramlibacter sp. AW1]|uniref:Non-homologous end joining protein Ku n=1 Tax=Ramlibacter aurantiacus TaxID=2801330 RepID=A0A937D026_9BURK|nr:Ku protein [Ramlibacter aurantiacus]MBL0418969.1 Ku protein [Ramlibacter aurantiacus]